MPDEQPETHQPETHRLKDHRPDKDERSNKDDSTREGLSDDDSPVERYRDSPGIAAFTDDVDVPEPNEPG